MIGSASSASAQGRVDWCSPHGFPPGCLSGHEGFGLGIFDGISGRPVSGMVAGLSCMAKPLSCMVFVLSGMPLAAAIAARMAGARRQVRLAGLPSGRDDHCCAGSDAALIIPQDAASHLDSGILCGGPSRPGMRVGIFFGPLG
jgi:hypothetical protein